MWALVGLGFRASGGVIAIGLDQRWCTPGMAQGGFDSNNAHSVIAALSLREVWLLVGSTW